MTRFLLRKKIDVFFFFDGDSAKCTELGFGSTACVEKCMCVMSEELMCLGVRRQGFGGVTC